MHQPAPPRFAFPALILANLVPGGRARGWCGSPTSARPSAGFWRLALAIPFLAFLALRQGGGQPLAGAGR